MVINHHCHFLRPKTFPQTITSSVTKLVRSKQVLGTPFIGNWAQNAAFLRRGMTRFHMFLLHLLPTKTPRPEPVGSMYGIFIPRCIIKKSTQLGRFSIPYHPCMIYIIYMYIYLHLGTIFCCIHMYNILTIHHECYGTREVPNLPRLWISKFTV